MVYGSLFSAVSGLKAQSNKIGITSDNISNVNTVGYKQGSAQFETLVTASGTSSSYSPGGVIANNRQLVDKQGLLQTTDAPTDIAISGAGFFVVRQRSDGTGQPLYTRAGSFRQDELGNFANAAGFYLYAWPLDQEGRLPGEPGNINTTATSNLDSLQVVNVSSSNGIATDTTRVEVGANLDAGEVIYPGAGVDAPIDALSTINATNNSTTILATDEYGASPTNGIERGDRFTVTTGGGLSYTYTLGGFSIGRDVTSGAVGDNTTATPTSLFETAVGAPASTIDTTLGSSTVSITRDVAHNLGPVGSTRTIVISGIVAGDLAGSSLTAGQINGTRTITITSATSFTFSAAAAEATASVSNSPLNAAAAYSDFAGNVLDATTASQLFLSTNSLTQFTTAARTFTITTATTGTVTFTYTTASPNALAQQFNNMTTLASAIDGVNGLTARVVSGRLYVGSEDANEAVTFANGDATGSGTLGGIDWVSELGVSNVTSSTNRYSTLQGLADLVNNSAGVSATVTNALSDSTIRIFNDDPLDTISFADYTGTATSLPNSLTVAAGGPPVTVTIAHPGHTFQVGDNIVLSGAAAVGGLTAPQLTGTFTIVGVGAGTYDIQVTAGPVAGGGPGGGAAVAVQDTNAGSVLAELGIVTSLNGAAYTPQSTGSLGPAYDSTGSVGGNMASGAITAQFSRNVRVYDALGSGHDLRLSFLKVATNTWSVEVHALPDTDVATTLVNGQVATGTLVFNGDGSLRSVSTGLSNPVSISWTNGAVPSTVTFDWGTAGFPFGTSGATAIGLTDGVSQFDSDYNVSFISQNGSPVGQLVGVTIGDDGTIYANYDNGETQAVYRIPLADFNNPNGLTTLNGNVFSESASSGEVNLRLAGTNGTGTVSSSALEGSNVDLAEELTNLIVAQRAYQANAKVITTSDQLLEVLTNL